MAQGTISSGAVLATVNGATVTVRAVTGLSGVSTGAQLLIMRQGATYWAVGVVLSAPVIPAVPTAPTVPPPDPGDPAPPPKPVVTTGALTISPVSTATWRDGSWRSDMGPVDYADTYQGRYAGSSFGANTGFAFYGSKPRTVAGATVTAASILVRRLTSGDFGLRASTLRCVSQSTRPGGFPTLNETTGGPSLGVQGQVSPSQATFAIPASWAQAMVDGTRGGIAMSIGGDSPYIHYAGRGAWSAAWTLTIYWRRG